MLDGSLLADAATDDASASVGGFTSTATATAAVRFLGTPAEPLPLELMDD